MLLQGLCRRVCNWEVKPFLVQILSYRVTKGVTAMRVIILVFYLFVSGCSE